MNYRKAVGELNQHRPQCSTGILNPLETIPQALATISQLAGAWSHNQKVVGSIPSPGTCGRQPSDASLSH